MAPWEVGRRKPQGQILETAVHNNLDPTASSKSTSYWEFSKSWSQKRRLELRQNKHPESTATAVALSAKPSKLLKGNKSILTTALTYTGSGEGVVEVMVLVAYRTPVRKSVHLPWTRDQ